MRKSLCWAVVGALGAAGVFGLTHTTAAPQRPGREPTLADRVAARSGVPVEDVEKVLKELGPAVSQELARGRVIEMPRLGVFRVVLIPEHRDLVDGRPAIIAATNYVEFLAAQGVVDAANAPGAVPAVTVPPFQYNPLPDRVPSDKLPNVRQPNVRTR